MSEYRVIEGDCRTVLASLDAGSVQTCITSPPYYGLRDYGHDGQIGLEETPVKYVAEMVDVFREVRRVLRDDGTLWLNLGDSYANDTFGQGGAGIQSANRGTRHSRTEAERYRGIPSGLKKKDLLGIPWMVAFALRADGWYLRSDIIWAKPNPMPESVTDRPTKAHEYLFLLSKSPRYYYDADAIAEDAEGRTDEDRAAIVNNLHSSPQLSGRGGFGGNTRNKRSVWTVATQPFPGAHFATFPPKLIEPCVLAGSSPQACGMCGAPWDRVVERTPMVVRPTEKRANWQADDDHARTQVGGTMTEAPTSKTVGWEATCSCDDAGAGRSTVLDPFNGAGTTGVVALRHDRDYIGIELNPDYAALARNRIYDDGPLLNVEAA